MHPGSRRVWNGTIVSVLGLLVLAGATASAQEPAEQPQLRWQQGPATAPIGDDLAEIEVGETYIFLDDAGTRKLLELSQNIVSGDELATLAPVSDTEQWFLIFEFEESGYVSDEEKDELDADAMLTSIREGTEAANEERRRRGWQEMTIVGWHEPPHYDWRTNNLSWAIEGSSGGEPNVNRIIKLLGRRGVMTATLVASPAELASAIPQVDSLLDSYRYTSGNTYAEYVPGTDKLAQYGLTALVVGGGAAALAKSGLLARMWKPIALGLVGLAAWLRRAVFGGRSTEHDPEKPIA